MSLLHRPPTAKPPAKGLPPKALPPGRAPGPATAAVAAPPSAAGAAKPAAPAAPSAAMAPAAPPRALPPVRPISTPSVDIAGLTPAMTAMVEAIRLYEDLLVEENAMLRAGDSAGVAALLDRKMHATRLYQERQRTVLGDSEATRSLTPEQRAQVVAAVRSLEDLAKENTVLLKANMSAIEQLFEVINTAARKMRKREVAYSQGGVIKDYHHAHSVSLAYNHTV